MKFEAPQSYEILGPLLAEQVLSQVPTFGKSKAELANAVADALKADSPASVELGRTNGSSKPLPDSFYESSTVGAQLRSLRAFIRNQENGDDKHPQDPDLHALASQTSNISLASNVSASCREIHEALLGLLVTASEKLPQEAQNVVDHSMLLRAKERYLFDAATNRNVVSDDPWARYAWDWVAGMAYSTAKSIGVLFM